MTSMQGERMELPAIESRPTLVPPAAYSIPPLGFDVRPSTPGPREKQRIAVTAFGVGAVFGALIMGVFGAAWHARTMASTVHAMAAQAAPVSLPVAASIQAAAAQAVAAPPLPAPATATPAAVADPSSPAAAAATPAAKPVKTAHHHAAPKAKSQLSLSAGNDDAFMRAIRQNAH